MVCHICSKVTLPFATARLLAKYDVQYFRCGNCGFIQTQTPYWLEEAYSAAINDSDIGLVRRNQAFAAITKVMIHVFFNSNAKFVDYGGGHGLLVRMMRDFGFDFYWHDKFCANLFARGFEAEGPGRSQYELLLAIELFEHLVCPVGEIEQMLQFSRNILFSTTLIPAHIPKPQEWWYYGLDHGQHVSLYTRESLALIAQRFHLNLFSNGKSLHLLTEKGIPAVLFTAMSYYRVALLLGMFLRRKSWIERDYARLTGKELN